MKIFSNISFKSFAAAAAAMLFATSAYATCQQNCQAYAHAEAEKVRQSVYSQVYTSCSHTAGHSTCSGAAITNSQYAYTQAYNYYYSKCTSENCGA